MGLIVNMNDFDTQNLFENIPKEVKVQISAEQLRLQIMERFSSISIRKGAMLILQLITGQ